MSDCREIETLLAAWVDGEVVNAEAAAVRAHLDVCGRCREALSAGRIAREVVVASRDRLRPVAPASLHARCAAHGAALTGAPRSRVVGWRTLVPLSMAASLLLAVAGVFVYSAIDQAGALASQVAFDHAKCARIGSPPSGDPVVSAVGWEAAHGWPVRAAPSATEHDLEFRTIRQCLVTEGRTAHMMYRWRGQPLSVFVLREPVDAVHVRRLVARFGYEAVLWTEGGRTYAVVARGRRDEMEPVVRYVQANTR